MPAKDDCIARQACQSLVQCLVHFFGGTFKEASTARDKERIAGEDAALVLLLRSGRRGVGILQEEGGTVLGMARGGIRLDLDLATGEEGKGVSVLDLLTQAGYLVGPAKDGGIGVGGVECLVAARVVKVVVRGDVADHLGDAVLLAVGLAGGHVKGIDEDALGGVRWVDDQVAVVVVAHRDGVYLHLGNWACAECSLSDESAGKGGEVREAKRRGRWLEQSRTWKEHI